MDVKTIFLNCDLEEKIYMKHPKGFVVPGQEHSLQACEFSLWTQEIP